MAHNAPLSSCKFAFAAGTGCQSPQCRQLHEEIVRLAVKERHQLETQVITDRSMRMLSSCNILIRFTLSETLGLVISVPGADIDVKYRNGLTIG